MRTDFIGIQMNRKELTEIVIMILNLNKLFGLYGLYKHISALKGLRVSTKGSQATILHLLLLNIPPPPSANNAVLWLAKCRIWSLLTPLQTRGIHTMLF